MRLPDDKLLLDEYHIRLNRAIDYILQHYDEKLTLDKISQMACLSKYHFHRIFHAMIGETLSDFIQRIRLEKSAFMLTNNLNKSITEIALDCGFSCSQNYAKAFKSYFGTVPSSLRKELNWDKLKIKMENIPEKKNCHMHPAEVHIRDIYYDKHQLSFQKILKKQTVPQVTISDIRDLRVAYIRSRGSYCCDKIEPSFTKLYKWADSKELMTDSSKVLSVIRSAPFITSEDKLLHDACITVPDSIKEDRWVNIQTLPGGKFAIYRCQVDVDHIDEAWIHLILNWLIYSDYQPDDRPLYQIYCDDFVKPRLRRQRMDLCFPIKSLYE